MTYQARVLADSINLGGNRLTTLEVTFPRIILAELNTHRMLSRNSASSRAIPVEKRIAAVLECPFIPETFGRNQKGMQADETLSGAEADEARAVWLDAMAQAVAHAKKISGLGVHKQLANRIIEPFCWTTAIISATEWNNFFALRCHPAAQPEIRRTAELMQEAILGSTPKLCVSSEDWHLPLVPDLDLLRQHPQHRMSVPFISAGRCARVSYLTHDGQRDPEADCGLSAKLKDAGHMSPFEHVAFPIAGGEVCGNFVGWKQLRKTFAGEAVFSAGPQ